MQSVTVWNLFQIFDWSQATYDGSDFMNQKKEELKVYIQMVLAFLKN